MPKIADLKQKRAAKLADMKKITSKAQEEKRVKSSEELTDWNNLKSEISELDTEIETLEFEERQAGEEAEKNFRQKEEDPEKKEMRKYNLAKAIKEAGSGRGLTGFEKEIQEEGEKEFKRFGSSPASGGIIIPTKVMRAAMSVAANSQHISQVAQGIDFINDNSILAQLGITVYEGLTDQIKMSFSDGFESVFLDEGATAAEAGYTEQEGELKARRIQGWKSFHNEYLAQTATMPDLLADMSRSLEVAVAKALFAEILALAPLAGFDADVDAGAALTWANVMKLKGALKTANFVNPKFVAGGELFASLEATRKDAGSGRMIIEGNKISAYDAVDAQGLIPAVADTAADADTEPTHSLIFGDWKRAYAGYYTGIEIIVDPYSAKKSGKTELSWSRLGDVEVNPNAFKAITNAIL